MMRRKVVFYSLLLILLFLVSVGKADGLIMSTGGTAGTYFSYGSVLADYVSKNSDVAITAVAGTGSADNIDAIDIGDYDLALVQNDVAYYAMNGIRFERYKGKPVKSFSALAALYDLSVQIVTNDPNIKSVSDLRGKNVSIGSSGSSVYFNALDILSVYGLGEKDISPQYLSFGDSAEALKDGKITAAFVVAGFPTSAVKDVLSSSNRCYVLSLDKDHITEILKNNPVYSESVIPAGTYPGQDDIVTTMAVKAVLIASNQISDEQA